MNNSKNLKYIVAGIVVVAAASIGLSLYHAVSGPPAGEVAVPVYRIPSDAALTVDGSVVTGDSVYLKPGKHSAQLTRSGFQPAFQDYTITTGGFDQAIDMALQQPTTTTTLTWYKANQTQYTAREGRAGKRATDLGAAFHSVNPITTQLPYSNLLYSIGYIRDPSNLQGNAIILQIDAQLGYRNSAIQKIRDLGFDPTDFKIQFVNYKDPFSS